MRCQKEIFSSFGPLYGRTAPSNISLNLLRLVALGRERVNHPLIQKDHRWHAFNDATESVGKLLATGLASAQLLGSRRVAHQEVDELGSRQSRGEKLPLRYVATEPAQKFEIRRRFNPIGDGRCSKMMG